MADIVGMLDEIQKKALKDSELRGRLLATQETAEPLKCFCEICRECGYEIYEMDVICAGEEFHAAMKRSTNGGGENSPMLGESDDFYALMMTSLKR